MSLLNYLFVLLMWRGWFSFVKCESPRFQADRFLSSANTTCAAGTGPLNTTTGSCPLCPAGTYSLGASQGSCLICTNAPANSFYVGSGNTNSDCAYECDIGYITEMCLDQFDYFFPYFGGLINTAVVFGVFSILSFVPRRWMMYAEKFGWWLNPNQNQNIIDLDQNDGEVKNSIHQP